MSEQFIPHPPSPPQPQDNKKNITPKQLAAAVFFLASFILLVVVIAIPGDSSSTKDTVAPAPVITAAPAPPVNKYDAYLEHVYNNSGQANTMTKAKLIEYGDIICEALDNGRTIAWITAYLSTYSEGQSDVELYASIIYGAVKNICPEYMSDMQSYLNS